MTTLRFFLLPRSIHSNIADRSSIHLSVYVSDPASRSLLEACLQKDPRKRLQSIGDVALLLGTLPAITSDAPTTHRFSRVVTLAAATVAVVASVALAALALGGIGLQLAVHASRRRRR
jgi:serine/threonine protein kinase